MAELLPAPRAVIADPLRHDGLGPDQPRVVTLAWTMLGLVVFVVIAVVITLLMASLAAVLPGSVDVWAMLGQLVGSIVGYLAMLACERRLRHAYELLPRRALVGGLVGLAVGAALMLICAGVLVISGLLVFEGINPAPQQLAWQVVQVGLVAGISEEIIFRGVMFRLLDRGLGTWAATAISGAIFGLIHLFNPQGSWLGAIAIAIEAGLLFGVLYAISRNLVLMMGIHAAWNVVQGPVLGIVVSGTSVGATGWLVSRPQGPQVLSGGSFGIEASLITVGLLSVVTIAAAVWLHRHHRVVQPGWVRRRRQSVTPSR